VFSNNGLALVKYSWKHGKVNFITTFLILSSLIFHHSLTTFFLLFFHSPRNFSFLRCRIFSSLLTHNIIIKGKAMRYQILLLTRRFMENYMCVLCNKNLWEKINLFLFSFWNSLANLCTYTTFTFHTILKGREIWKWTKNYIR
jgi:hypothetical protein